MNHFGPDLQIDADIGGAGRFGQPDRVVKQGLRRTDLDQQRRQALEIGVDWRGQWRARVGGRRDRARPFLGDPAAAP